MKIRILFSNIFYSRVSGWLFFSVLLCFVLLLTKFLIGFRACSKNQNKTNSRSARLSTLHVIFFVNFFKEVKKFFQKYELQTEIELPSNIICSMQHRRPSTSLNHPPCRSGKKCNKSPNFWRNRLSTRKSKEIKFRARAHVVTKCDQFNWIHHLTELPAWRCKLQPKK